MVKENYKMSELGLIPHNWEILELCDNFDFFQNNTYSRDCMNSSNGTVQNIHYGDVLIKYGAILDCEMETVPFINQDIQVNLVKRLVRSGDIIIADTAEDNTVGKATEVINVGNKNVISGLHTIFVRPHLGLFAERFLGYFINSSTYHDQLLQYIVGTKVSSVSKGSLQKTLVLQPPLAEQRRIAEVLSDTDALIAAMEKLIAKKQAIKQGAMQELLTGKRRLVGFEEEWIEKKLSFCINDFIVPMRDKPKNLTGDIPWCRIEDFEGKYLYKSKSNQGVNFEAVVAMNLKIYPLNTLIVSCSAYLGRCAIIKKELVTNQTFIGLVPNENTDVEYLFYAMCMEEQKLNTLSSGTTISYLSREQWEEYLLLFPPTKLEQTAIAAILSDMDIEIDALTTKLNKLRNIKQGMMSELLTGRIRLLEQDAENSKIVELPTSDSHTKVKTGGHSQQFDDAVMIAGIVNVLYSEKYFLGRKKVQKCLYLLRRHKDESTKAFKKKAAGPYADQVRYKGGEPIAQSAKYIVTTTTKGKGTVFARGEEINKALEYIEVWQRQADMQWVADKLKYKTGDELELLATVDMAICDLAEAGIAVSVASIKHLIAINPEWKAKLQKEIFTDNKIAYAIQELQTLLI